MVFETNGKNAILVKYNGNKNELVIPSTIKKGLKKYNVTEIGKYAFDNCSIVRTIYLTSGIKDIGNYAFANCRELVSIKVPNTVEKLDSINFEYSYNVSLYCEQKSMPANWYEHLGAVVKIHWDSYED